jgi:hypothetical protein
MALLISGTALVCFAAEGDNRGESVGSMGLIFTVSLPKEEFEQSEAVPLKLVIKNGSQQEQTIPSLFVNAEDESISIRSGMYLICQKGAQVLVFKGTYFKTSETGRTLESGASYEAFELDLHRCFDLEAGTYDIQLLFTTRYSGFVDAASNRLTYTVRPKESKAVGPPLSRTISPASLLKRNADGSLLIAIKPHVYARLNAHDLVVDEQGHESSEVHLVIAFSIEDRDYHTIWGVESGKAPPAALDPSKEYTFLVKPYREVEDKRVSIPCAVLEVRDHDKLLYRKKEATQPTNPPDEE